MTAKNTYIILDTTDGMYKSSPFVEGQKHIDLGVSLVEYIMRDFLINSEGRKSYNISFWAVTDSYEQLIDREKIAPEVFKNLYKYKRSITQPPGIPQSRIFDCVFELVSTMLNSKTQKRSLETKIILISTFVGEYDLMSEALNEVFKCLKFHGAQLELVSFERESPALREMLNPSSNEETEIDKEAEPKPHPTESSAEEGELAIPPLVIFSAEEAFQQYVDIPSKQFGPSYKFTGFFELTPELVLPVRIVSKVASMEGQHPIKKYSKLVENPDREAAIGKVDQTKSYVYQEEDQMVETSADQLIKGFYYGKMIVPFPKDIKDLICSKEVKRLRLLAFSKARDIKRCYLISRPDVVVPHLSKKNSRRDIQEVKTFNALVISMIEEAKVAICRFVFRNTSPPKLMAFFPRFGAEGRKQLVGYEMPTSENIRSFPFMSLPTSTEEQKEAIVDLIQKMDLTDVAKFGGIEPVQPENLRNPAASQLILNLIARFVNPQAPIALLPEEYTDLHFFVEKRHQLDKQTEDRINAIFNLKIAQVKKVERKKLYWSDAIKKEEVRLESMGQKKAEEGDFSRPTSLMDERRLKELSLVHPISDFHSLLSNKKTDLTLLALDLMTAAIDRLVQESIKDHFFAKALDCMLELRRECIKNDEVEYFNKWLNSYKHTCKRDMWLLVLKNGMSIISSDENATSKHSELESRQWLLEEEKMLFEKKEATGLMMKAEDNLDDIE